MSVSPIIPGLSKSHVRPILERARATGVQDAFMTLPRLPREVLPVFTARILERAVHIRSAQQDMRGGQMNTAQFGDRMRGTGARWIPCANSFTPGAAGLA